MGDGRTRSDCTDDELRHAVGCQTSWRGVLRSLGYKPSSAGVLRRLKRRATQLQVDITHFTGQRRWSDGQLKDAVARATSWAEVLRLLDVSDRAEARARVKGHSQRLQLDVTHLTAATGLRSEEAEQLAPLPDPTALRSAAPSIVTAWLMLRGLPVSLPVEPQGYDLLVHMPHGIQRVQVKSTTFRAANGRWQVRVGRQGHNAAGSSTTAPYDPDLVDYFAVVTGDGAVYLIPTAVIAGLTGICPESYASYRVGDASSLLGGAVLESAPALAG